MQKIVFIGFIFAFLFSCSINEKKVVEVLPSDSNTKPLSETLGVIEENGQEVIQEPVEVKLALENKKNKNTKIKKTKIAQKPEINEPKIVLKDIFLIRISSNYNSKTYDLAVQVNQDNLIQNIKVRNNKKNRTKVYGLDRLGSDMTLVKTAGISLVTLKCINFSQDKGCRIEIEYPYNLTYGNFDVFHAEIKKDGNSWRFFSGPKPFRRMRLISKKLFGLLIGVERVELLP